MQGMTNQKRRKNTGEPGNGGKYAAHSPEEATTTLTEAQHTIDLGGTKIALDTSYLDDLPDLPAGISEPSVSWEYDANKMQVHLSFGDEDLTVWGDDEETFNSIVDAYDPSPQRTPWGDDTEAVLEYATELFHRVDGLAYEVTKSLEPITQSAIIAAALGKPVDQATMRRSDLNQKVGAPASAVISVDRFIGGWVDVPKVTDPGVDYSEDYQTAMNDALTDLRHWAKAKGIDFDEAFDRSETAAAGEEADPWF